MTAAGLGDTFATPFDRVAPGVEIFATAISNLLSGDTLARTPSTRRIDAVMAAGLPVAMIAFIAMRRAAVGLALAALVFLFWAGGVFLAFVNGYWLSMALPLATSVPLIAGYTGARFLVERHSGRKAIAERAMLAKFQSPLLLDHMLREPQFLDKPVRQDVAVMFLDLTGSTGVVEVLGPELSRDLLHVDADTGGAGGDGAPRHRHQLYGRRGSGGLRTAEAAERRRRAGIGHGREPLHVSRRLGGRSAARRRGIASTFASAFISARLSCRGSVRRPINRSPPLGTPSMSRAGSSRWRSSSTAASSSRKICSRPRARPLDPRTWTWKHTRP